MAGDTRLEKREPFYLSDEAIQRLKDMDGDITFYESELRRAEYVGLDVKELRTKVADMKAIRVKAIETYSKPKP